MPALVIDRDDIDGLRPVELIDLVAAIDHRDVPVEEIDELELPVGEHGLQRPALAGRQVIFDDADHGPTPVAGTASRGAENRTRDIPSRCSGLT